MLRALLWLMIAGAAQAAPLVAMFGQSRPPFVDEKHNSGLVVELTDRALALLGLEARHRFASNHRLLAELKARRIDLAVEVQPDDPALFYSEAFVAYRNYAVSRDGQRYAEWSDMAGQSVCAWQGAREHLGESFRYASLAFAAYREYPQQAMQVADWVTGKCSIIFIDDTLLREHLRTLATRRITLPAGVQLRYTPLAGAHELWWYVGFHDRELRDRFNAALRTMHLDGSYHRIREAGNIAPPEL